MFWKFGGYANISPIDSILERSDFTLEELLEESELIGDIKAHNNKLIDYLRQPEVVSRLLEYVVAPRLEIDPAASKENNEKEQVPADSEAERGRPRALAFGRSRASSSATDGGIDEDDEVEKKRTRYAFVACEILSSDNWPICDTIMDPAYRSQLHKFWEFLKRPAPLDPLQASYFTKVNESLFDRKVEDMVEFLKVADNAVQDMLRHVDCPTVMDLLLKIITLDRPEAYQGIVEYLYTQDLMPTLLSFLGPANSWATQTSAGDFIKAIITVSANATQHEQTCIGPNELTRQLVSHPCIDELIGYMLKGGNALAVGVGIVIEVIRKNNSDYDPDVGTEANSIPSSRDPIYLGTLLRMFAQNVPNFMQLMNNAPAQKARLNSTFGEKIEPLGFDRFKTCELMAELLHCSNMGLLNEVGSEELIAVRDAQRKRLRTEGKLTPNRGEEASPASTDLLTMGLAHTSSANDGRRLEVTNITAADDDGFEEVTHSAGLEEDYQTHEGELPNKPEPPSASSTSHSFMDKDEDDFVEEPLSSPRLKTHDENVLEDVDHHFDDPDLMVAPLSPSKKKSTAPEGFDQDVEVPPVALDGVADVTAKDDFTEGSDDFVTEATEPALGDEAKRMVPDLEKGDDSDSSIYFTPTISSLPDSLNPSVRSPSPPTESSMPARTQEPHERPPSTHDETAEKLQTSEAVVPETQPETLEPAEGAAPGEEEKYLKPDLRTTGEATGATEPEADFGDASIIVTHPLAGSRAAREPGLDAPFSDPVVGDYLKMQFVDHRVVPTILSYFFSYPWNNFLHNVVYDVVQQVFNGPMDRSFNPHLAISLFESADITTQIVNGQTVSDQSQAATKLRMGYMGHLTLIAEEVVKFTERHPAELLSETVVSKIMSPDWTNYIDGTLTETRERDNATLGGVRPDAAMGNHAAANGLAAVGLAGLGSSLGLNGSQGTSNALAEAGLNGGLDLHSELETQGGNDGPFSISAGISSGFHSSSDEEDDDADDNDDDINNEFRAYTDPLNSSSSLLPPAIPPPPPPPPLNIPPSRARQLLAARLAMNKRNAESAAAQEADNLDEKEGSSSRSAADSSGDVGNESHMAAPGTKSLSSMLGSERLRNPFADDDDDMEADDDGDDDEDDDDTGLNGGDVGRVGLRWNRGGWWRSMVRRDRNNNGDNGSDQAGASNTDDFDHEKFGDGRDSSSDGGNSSGGDGDDSTSKAKHHSGRRLDVGVTEDDDEDDDEEFGDFAMPEAGKDATSGVDVPEGGEAGESNDGVMHDNGHKPALFKPLALHPTASSSGSLASSSATAGGSLWRLGFLGSAGNNTDGEGSADSQSQPKQHSTSSLHGEDDLEVLGEDGQRVARVTEATRRTSIEDPDEDEVVV